MNIVVPHHNNTHTTTMADKLFYYSKSAHKLPGRGANERVANSSEYAQLALIKDWRKMLSNFHVAKFKLDGHTWASVEHYYHSRKFIKNNPKFAYMFAIESGSVFCLDPVKAKSAGGKTGIVREAKVIIYKRSKEIVADNNFFGESVQNAAFMDAMLAKFSQHDDLKHVLLATGSAELWHGARGPPARIWPLECVRTMLLSQS